MRNIIYLHRYKREFSNTPVTEKIKMEKEKKKQKRFVLVMGSAMGHGVGTR